MSNINLEIIKEEAVEIEDALGILYSVRTGAFPASISRRIVSIREDIEELFEEIQDYLEDEEDDDE